MRRLASLATAARQSGHRKQYEPRSSSAHTRTVRSSAVSCTSPQLGQLALIVVTASPVPGPLRGPATHPPCRRLYTPFGRPLGPLEGPDDALWSHLGCGERDAVARCVAMAVITFAHRGARLEEPENTIPAFRRALEPGVTRPRDRRVAVAPTARSCARTTRRSAEGLRRRKIATATAAELAELGVPRLADVYEELGTAFEMLGRREVGRRRAAGARRGRPRATTRSSASGCAPPTSSCSGRCATSRAVKLVHSDRAARDPRAARTPRVRPRRRSASTR